MYNLNLRLSVFIKVYIDNYNIPITLFVDTGADVSLIKNDIFSDNQINKNRITTLSGIGQGKIRSIGTTFFDLKFKNCLIPHYFHVVHNDFPIPNTGYVTEYWVWIFLGNITVY